MSAAEVSTPLRAAAAPSTPRSQERDGNFEGRKIAKRQIIAPLLGSLILYVGPQSIVYGVAAVAFAIFSYQPNLSIPDQIPLKIKGIAIPIPKDFLANSYGCFFSLIGFKEAIAASFVASAQLSVLAAAVYITAAYFCFKFARENQTGITVDANKLVRDGANLAAVGVKYAQTEFGLQSSPGGIPPQ